MLNMDNKIKSIISEIVENEINKLLSEEQGIADIVYSDSIKVAKLASDISKKTIPQKYNGYTKRNFSFTSKIFNELEIKFIFNFYNFANYESFENNVMNLNLQGSSSLNDKQININYFAINGLVDDKSFYDQLQHELSHLYRAYKKGTPLLSSKRSKLYNTSVELMQSNNPYFKMVGKIVYLSFFEEQNGYENGTYNLLMVNADYSNLKDIFIQSDAYKGLSELNYYNYLLENNKFDNNDLEQINIALSRINKDINWLKSILPKAIHSFSKKLSRVYYKANNDIRKKFIVNGGLL